MSSGQAIDVPRVVVSDGHNGFTSDNNMQNNGEPVGFYANNLRRVNNKVSPLPPLDFPKNNVIGRMQPGDFEVIWQKLSYTLTKVSLKSKSRRNILENLNGFSAVVK